MEVEPGSVNVCHCRDCQCFPVPPFVLAFRLGRPAHQIWTKRRLSWIPRMEGVPEAEGQPCRFPPGSFD